MKRFVVLAGAVTASLMTSAVSLAVVYQPTIIGALPAPAGEPPSYSSATSINNYGQVVGVSSHPDYKRAEAMLWQPVGPNSPRGELHSLKPVFENRAITNEPGLNNAGQLYRASMVYTPSSPNTFGSFTAAAGDRLPNDLGQVLLTSGNFVRVRFADNTTLELGPGTFANFDGGRLNNAGQVLGYSADRDELVLFTPAGPNARSGTLTPLGYFRGGAFDSVFGEDGSVAVTEYESTSTGVKVTATRLWKPSSPNSATGGFIDLAGALGRSAVQVSAINRNGDVVTASSDYNSIGAFEMYNSYSGSIQQISSSYVLPDGSTISGFFADGLNDFGQLIGSGRVSIPGGVQDYEMAVLLTPVPEVGSGMGLVMLLAPMLCRRFRRN